MGSHSMCCFRGCWTFHPGPGRTASIWWIFSETREAATETRSLYPTPQSSSSELLPSALSRHRHCCVVSPSCYRIELKLTRMTDVQFIDCLNIAKVYVTASMLKPRSCGRKLTNTSLSTLLISGAINVIKGWRLHVLPPEKVDLVAKL